MLGGSALSHELYESGMQLGRIGYWAKVCAGTDPLTGSQVNRACVSPALCMPDLE